ncbi:2Fe-2S iron-sulfur cluster-binding protein [Roseomonas chloroacetimidivorans]|uniref:2Fe-2S iron-sulfur cluster-binding protein n=1 Tax=Roseomonas chloroacetimidivorans TaxID=1766656 RepID=UPI003C750AF8
MPRVTYVSADGQETSLELEEGMSVMEGAVANGVDGIVGECGGSLMCATCHVYVDEDHLSKLSARGEVEEEMLDSAAAEVLPNSRLSCQIRVTPELDGLVVRLPESQR